MRPLLVVPALFGTEIRDQELGVIWGTFACLYRRRPPISSLDGLRGQPGKVMSEIPILAGIRYDVFGSLLRALEGAGYRRGETLHLFAYDWRLPVLDVGRQLTTEIRRLAASAGGEVDLLGLSNGGLLLRAAFALDRALPVRRVVTSGAPLGGSLETLACLHGGFQFAPLGRTVSPEEFVACPGSLDSIPEPGHRSFVDDSYDLYNVDTWKRLRLSIFRAGCNGHSEGNGKDATDETWTRVLDQRLRATRASWELMRTAAAPRHLVCVCGAGLPTQARIVVQDGKALVPGEGKVRDLPAAALADGDGGVCLDSASDWAGADAQVIRIPVGRHRDVVRTAPAFAAILKGLAVN